MISISGHCTDNILNCIVLVIIIYRKKDTLKFNKQDVKNYVITITFGIFVRVTLKDGLKNKNILLLVHMNVIYFKPLCVFVESIC